MAWTSPRTWVAGEVVTAALLNTHLRDNLLELNSTASAWTTFAPTLSGFALSGSNIRYKQIGKTVHVQIDGLISITSTTFSTTLPVPAANLAINRVVGVALGVDVSPSNNYTGLAIGFSGTTVGFISNNSASPWAPAFPFTWAVSDPFSCQFTYEAA